MILLIRAHESNAAGAAGGIGISGLPALSGFFPLLTALIPVIFIFFAAEALGSPLDFTSFRLGSGDRAVLVVGGIQGDEPGGFSAATLLATRYEIRKGALWVVPNLNFPSIIMRSRGLHGDMNRKFAALDINDPEFATVSRIKNLILRPEVALVLNLHDGSGFYRPRYEDRLKNPRRWGQSIIIDQESLGGNVFMGALAREANAVAGNVNKMLASPRHALHVRNTNTAAGDKEMEKSLSYYAVRKQKAAFGLEASKEFGVAMRAYYHLCMVEEFLRLAGLEFSRDFELSPKGVENALGQNIGVSFAENRVFLPLDDARPAINYLPLPRGSEARAITSKPIMAVLPCRGSENRLCIHYGNRTITLINPDWRDMEDGLDAVNVIIDGEERIAAFGQVVDVANAIRINSPPGFRVNAIGANMGVEDESGIPLRRKDFETRFSVDRAGSLFRVEVYKGRNFAGMFLLRFTGRKNPAHAGSKKQEPLLPDKSGPESSLGF